MIVNRFVSHLFCVAIVAAAAVLLPSGSVRAQYDPVANDSAVVTSGYARFTVLTPEMIRIQYSKTRKFENRATFAVVNRRLPVPEYTVTRDSKYLYITTSALKLKYRLFSQISADEYSPDKLTITFNMNGQEVIWYPGKDNSLNLKGTTRTLDQAIGDSKMDQMEDGILSRAGWAVIDESPTAKRGDGSTTFAFDKTVDGIPWVAKPVDKDAIDWYFMGYGHQYKKALGDFIKIAGREPMPPQYILGYWYSRYWRYTQNDFMNLIREIQSNKIPLDVMIMDKDWHTPGWTGWTWDTSIIPTPQALISWMHNRGIKTSLNLHPADGVDSDEAQFEQLRKDMGLDSTATVVPWQLEDSTFYKNMWKDVIRPLERQGVDFWWLDWQQNLTNPRLTGLSETFWCNHVFYNDMQQHRKDRRTVIFHRWGGLGSHRYPIGFSGDAVIDYSTLNFETYFTPTASNVCFGYWGHDLGGHTLPAADPNDPELLLRWIQFGVFTPIFRTHATNSSRIERRIWKYSNFPLMRQAVMLRYHLIPYIYTAARQAYDTGVSICRPLYYDSPEENNAYRYRNEYMFGDNILVSPIVAAAESDGKAYRKTWLPEGNWYNVCRGRVEQGGREIYDGYEQSEIPYFYRGGSVIVEYPDIYNLQKRPDTLVVEVVPGGSGKYDLYEDENDNENYRNGSYSTTTFSQARGQGVVTLTIAPTQGQYAGMPSQRSYRVRFLAEEQPEGVSINGTEADASQWTYDATTKMVEVTIVSVPLSNSTTVTLRQNPTAIAKVKVDKTAAAAPLYNVEGVKVNGRYNGIVISKGKKRINKSNRNED